jgi:hypothetical protein
LPGTDGEFHSITETLSAPFTRGQGYSVCWVANNATAGSTAIALPFKFGQPFISYDGTTSNITTNSATLSVPASGSGAASTARFQIRQQKSCFSGGRTVDAADPLPADYDLHTIKASVTGLEPNTAYCWVASATNDAGTAGTDENFGAIEFKTLPTPADSVTGPSSAGTATPTTAGEVVIPVVAGCGKGPCTYTSTATAPAASGASASAAKAKRVVVAVGKLKLKTGKESPIRLKLTPAGKKLLKRKKSVAVTVAVNGRDGAGRKSSKTVRAKFKALKAR